MVVDDGDVIIVIVKKTSGCLFVYILMDIVVYKKLGVKLFLREIARTIYCLA
jgi:hypothetical protein